MLAFDSPPWLQFNMLLYPSSPTKQLPICPQCLQFNMLPAILCFEFPILLTILVSWFLLLPRRVSDSQHCNSFLVGIADELNESLHMSQMKYLFWLHAGNAIEECSRHSLGKVFPCLNSFQMKHGKYQSFKRVLTNRESETETTIIVFTRPKNMFQLVWLPGSLPDKIRSCFWWPWRWRSTWRWWGKVGKLAAPVEIVTPWYNLGTPCASESPPTSSLPT